MESTKYNKITVSLGWRVVFMFFALNYMHMAALVYEIQVVATTTTE